MDKLENDLKEVIKNNLPQKIGETLQAELTRLKCIEEEHESLKNEHKRLVDEDKNKAGIITDLEKEVTKHYTLSEALRLKEIELCKKEKDLEIREIRVLNEITKKECAEKNANDLKEVIGIVFKNPVVQRSVVETQGGQWNWNQEKNINEFCPDGNGSKIESETTN